MEASDIPSGSAHTNMVAPYEIGDPVRSFVRVPGSGSDKKAKSLCCDLARVSSAAAAVPVRPVTPAATQPRSAEVENNGPKRKALQAKVEKDEEKVGEKKEVQLKVEKEDEIEESQQSVAEQGGEQVKCKKRHAEDSSIVVHAKRGRASKEDESEVSPDSSKATDTSKGGERSAEHEKLKMLEKQCIELKQQNHQLQQRLSLFCKLFKDPKKLAFALKRMEAQTS